MTASLPNDPQHRHEFVLLFDVINGNPNGDPDQGNVPRQDPETGHGLVSDVCLKRKIRDFVTLSETDPTTGTTKAGYDIYVKHHGVLEQLHQQAYDAEGLKIEKGKLKQENVAKARAWMCQTFFDVRAFGAVMSTGINCGQVRGPVQIAFARSIDPIFEMSQSIVRKAVTKEPEAEKQIKKHGQVTGTMGRKEIIPYGLYRAHGFYSPHLASDTGFSGRDMELLWQALTTMFEHDHSAMRGEMATRRLIVFEHESRLGNAPAHRLFERVTVAPKPGSEPPARSFSYYDVSLDRENLPNGITVHELV